MRTWIAMALALCLMACGELGAPPPPASETPAAEAPDQAPVNNDIVDGPCIACKEPTPPAPDASGPALGTQPAPAPSTPSETRTNVQERVLTPVLVELMPAEAREPRQGGSAAVVLADPASPLGAARNLSLCRSLFLTFDQATTREVAVGARRGAEGEVQLLRPIYWLTRTVTPGQPGADRCPQRLETYDYPRAQRIKRKLGLTGEGPYLVVERNDRSTTERVAAVIDLSRTRATDVPEMVRYFRDGFVQLGDIWDPRRYQPAAAETNIASFFGRTVSLGLMPRLVRATRQIGCPLTNLLDVCSGPG